MRHAAKKRRMPICVDGSVTILNLWQFERRTENIIILYLFCIISAYGNIVGLEDETFDTLKTIVNGMRGLKRLVLKNCFLGDLEPLRTFMDAVVVGKSDTIEHLDVTNLTKTPIESLWFPVFVSLKTLVITTNFLTETLLAEIAASG